MIQTAIAIVVTNIVSNYIARKNIKTCKYSLNGSAFIVFLISLLEIIPFYIAYEETIKYFITNESDIILL